jgi:transposase-like protein
VPNVCGNNPIIKSRPRSHMFVTQNMYDRQSRFICLTCCRSRVHQTNSCPVCTV